jgi:clan AA aspartic protease (TIGR02281 family)
MASMSIRVRLLTRIALAGVLLAGCGNVANTYGGGYNTAGIDQHCENQTGGEFALWQCRQFYVHEKINGDCLREPGGQTAILQCQRFYGNIYAQLHAQQSSEPPSVVDASSAPASPQSGTLAIPLQRQGGIFMVPVAINNAITLQFAIDSGATDVSIPADVVLTLMRTGTLRSSDFLGTTTYVLADGSAVPSATFRIRVLKVGGREIENVTGSVAGVRGELLLGQSFLNRFKSWSIDNERQILVLH